MPAEDRAIEVLYRDEVRIEQVEQDHATLSEAAVKPICSIRPALALSVHIRQGLHHAP